MANNFKVTEGIGPPVATDEITSVHYQVVKLAAGQEESTARIEGTAANGLEVDVTRLPSGTVAGAASLPAGTNNIGDVDIASALPAGTNNIGDVDIASIAAGDNNIGNVDIASMPGNVNAQLLASAARTATTNSPDQTNVNGRGVVLLLDVTANPGGIETLTVSIEAKLGGDYRAITAFAAAAAGTNATYIYQCYPGIVETSAVGNVEVQGLVLPRDWRAVVTHSSTGSWTYSLESSLIV